RTPGCEAGAALGAPGSQARRRDRCGLCRRCGSHVHPHRSSVSATGADRLALVQTPRDYGTPFETVEFRPPDQPIKLRAWWMPAAPAKAAIILVHGGGDDNRSLPYADGLKLAHDLVGHGYAVFSVDLRNYGESDATPEGVTFGDAEADDIIGAMNYLGSHHPGLRYGGLGFSMGGEVLLSRAARAARWEAV